jgi:hypothetical protein
LDGRKSHNNFAAYVPDQTNWPNGSFEKFKNWPSGRNERPLTERADTSKPPNLFPHAMHRGNEPVGISTLKWKEIPKANHDRA